MAADFRQIATLFVWGALAIGLVRNGNQFARVITAVGTQWQASIGVLAGPPRSGGRNG